MANLAMTEKKAAKLNEVEDLALGILSDALKGVMDADDEQVKVATKTLSVVAKNRQTLTHREAINFSMASTISTEAELKKYVSATNPGIRNAITGKRNYANLDAADKNG